MIAAGQLLGVHRVQAVCFNPASFGFLPSSPPSPLPNLLFQAAGTRSALHLAVYYPSPGSGWPWRRTMQQWEWRR